MSRLHKILVLTKTNKKEKAYKLSLQYLHLESNNHIKINLPNKL